ncbi:MAG: hypothetical protein Q8N03_02735 [Ignavibacteria bacterium]|nr:hypothetical protein [Ignavibacteria bacterium]
MKNLFYILLTLILVSSQIYTQPNRGKNHRNMDKIAQLEKIKLMEILELDEETSVKFFVRLKDHRLKMRENMVQLDLLIDEMRKIIDEDSFEKGDNSFKKFNDNFISLENNGIKIRLDFIKSIGDLLSPSQISKFLVFEKAFRSEMQDLLMKPRGGRGMR